MIPRVYWTLVLLGMAGLLGMGCGPGRVPMQGLERSPRTSIPRRYVCSRAQTPIVVDGRLNEPAWAEVPWTEPFIDIEGPAKPPPRYRTRAKLCWDDGYLYIGAELEEPHVWGTLTEHDQIVFHDNDFELFIDPDGDAREYYEVEINALNTIFDLLLVRTYRDGGPADHDWNLDGLKSAVFVDGSVNDPGDVDTGWSLELALPWASLAEYAHRPSPPRAGDTWRMNFSRVEWPLLVVDGSYAKPADATENNWVWSPQGEINMHIPEHWGHVEFAGNGEP
ncbi:MAG: hypothetical protein GY842_26155 [bacterium]|nr:hypothetical protein [bacterium]